MRNCTTSNFIGCVCTCFQQYRRTKILRSTQSSNIFTQSAFISVDKIFHSGMFCSCWFITNRYANTFKEIYCCDTIISGILMKAIAERFFVRNFRFTYQIGHLIAAYVAHYIAKSTIIHFIQIPKITKTWPRFEIKSFLHLPKWNLNQVNFVSFSKPLFLQQNDCSLKSLRKCYIRMKRTLLKKLLERVESALHLVTTEFC